MVTWGAPLSTLAACAMSWEIRAGWWSVWHLKLLQAIFCVRHLWPSDGVQFLESTPCTQCTQRAGLRRHAQTEVLSVLIWATRREFVLYVREHRWASAKASPGSCTTVQCLLGRAQLRLLSCICCIPSMASRTISLTTTIVSWSRRPHGLTSTLGAWALLASRYI